MRQFLAGAICGAAAATLAYWLVAGRGTGEAATAQPAPRVAVTPYEPARTADLAQQGSVAQATAQPPKVIAATTTPSTPPPPIITVVRPTSSQAVSPLNLSADHAKILAPENNERRPPSLTELHSQFATETKDPNWSLEMEQNITQVIAKNNSSGEFEVLAVECRSTLCEIRAFGNLPTSAQLWNQVGAEMSRQPWWPNFQGNSTSSSGQNGRTTIVTILQRTKK
jgi:hypothetical protein